MAQTQSPSASTLATNTSSELFDVSVGTDPNVNSLLNEPATMADPSASVDTSMASAKSSSGSLPPALVAQTQSPSASTLATNTSSTPPAVSAATDPNVTCVENPPVTMADPSTSVETAQA